MKISIYSDRDWSAVTLTYPEKHFHPSGALGDHEPACIEHEEPLLVTLVVIKCWLDAARSGNPSVLNQQVNPP